MTFVLCYSDLGGARHELVSVFWLAVTGASCLQVLWLLKDDAISGLYGYHRWIFCSGIQCVAMQTLPAASVKFSLEDVRNPSRLNREGWGATTVWSGGGEVGGLTGGDRLLQMIYLSVWCKKNLDLLQLGDTYLEFNSVRKFFSFCFEIRALWGVHMEQVLTLSARRRSK